MEGAPGRPDMKRLLGFAGYSDQRMDRFDYSIRSIKKVWSIIHLSTDRI